MQRLYRLITNQFNNKDTIFLKIMLRFVLKKFEGLSNYELYVLLQLRSEVFVVEQNCVFLDLDGTPDFEAYHLLAYHDTELWAAARLLAKGVSYAEYASVGRIVNSSKARGKGIGKALMQEAMQQMAALFPNDSIKIGAQQYLENFYNSFGFQTISEPYLEDGIWHIHMVKKA